MSNYKHGVYSVVEKSELQTTQSLGTVPAYIGSLPIQRLNKGGISNYNYAEYINKPILLSSYNDVKNMGIYSDDWNTYTACEAIHAHFMNEVESVAPIIIINILNPETLKSSATTKEVILKKQGVSKVGYIEDPLCSIDDMTITGEETTFEDGDVIYSYEGDKVKVTIINDKKDLTKITVSYKQVDFDKTAIDEVEFNKALNGLKMSEVATGYIPNILAAPYFSQKPTLHTLMVQMAMDKIAEKWGFVIVSDIPCDSNVNTLEKVKAWKESNQYNSKFDKVCYPKVTNGTKTYHLSTLTAYTMQATDLHNDDVPFVSPSNKILNCTGAVLENGTPFFMTETEANSLNEVGITTVNIVQRRLRLWGSHMANYDFAKLSGIVYEERSDSDIRMMLYITNNLQYNYIDSIDTPFTRKDIDGIVTSVQQWLNSLVNEGKLLYATIVFNSDETSTESIINGDFVFDVTPTYTPNAKSLTFKTCYTTAGINTLLGGAE